MDFASAGLILGPVVQGLVVNGLTRTGRQFAQGASDLSDYSDPSKVFAVQTLSIDHITELLAETGLADGLAQLKVAPEDVLVVLGRPDAEVLVHELLTSRLLEQPEAFSEKVGCSFKHLFELYLPNQLGGAEPGEVAALAFASIDSVCQTLVLQLDIIGSVERSSIQQLAGLSAVSATLKSIDEHLEQLARSSNQDRDSWPSFEQKYRDYVARKHGYLTVPDADMERKVPVDDLYVEADLHGLDGMDYSLPRDLGRLQRLVVTGSPGGGKSTLSSVSCFRLAADPVRVPLLVVLRDFGPDHEQGRTIVQHLERVICLRAQEQIPVGWLESVLFNGRATVVFDGLDELLDPAHRRDIRDAVEQFGLQYPQADILVTSRVVGYEQAPLDGREYHHIRLGEFSEGSVEQYTRAWFGLSLSELDPESRERRIAAFLRESESVAEIRSNPLMLSLMSVLYRSDNYIPESRLALYEECAKLLFKKWDRSRGISTKLAIGSDIDLALMYLAHWIITNSNDDDGLTERRLVDICVDFLVPRRFDDREPARAVAEEFVQYCRGRAWVLADAGTDERGERLYTFTHRTFLEFFAASQFARLNDTPEKVSAALVPYVGDAQLDVVGQLALQIANRSHDNGADRFVATMMDRAVEAEGKTRMHLLSFVARAMRFHMAAPALLRRIVDDVLEFTLDMPREVQRLVERSRPSVREDTGTEQALCALLDCHEANLDVVASRLSECLDPLLAELPAENSTRHDRALAVACLARAIMTSDSDMERYDFWADWSLDRVSEIAQFDGWDIEARSPLASVGALEAGLLDLTDFVGSADAASLVCSMPTNEFSISRIATVPLLGGWILGTYWPRVTLQSAGERMLASLNARLVSGGSVEIEIGSLHVLSDAETRLGTLDGDALGGAILLLCLFFEERADELPRYLPEQAESLDKVDPLTQQAVLLARHPLMRLLEFGRASSDPYLRAYAHLCDVRLGSASVDEAQLLALGGLSAEALLLDWARGALSLRRSADVDA